ncbi:hypothetical protein GCM10010407_08410 [Rarobacter incanus]
MHRRPAAKRQHAAELWRTVTAVAMVRIAAVAKVRIAAVAMVRIINVCTAAVAMVRTADNVRAAAAQRPGKEFRFEAPKVGLPVSGEDHGYG